MPKTYEPIATQTLASTASTVTFSSIGSTYTDLVLVVMARSSYTSDAFDGLRCRFNSDTATNYSWTFLGGNGSTLEIGRASSQGIAELGALETSSASNTAFSTNISNIQNYANNTTFKTVVSRSGEARTVVYQYVTLWRKTPEAITQIDLTSSRGSTFVVGSTFTLYGIKAA